MPIDFQLIRPVGQLSLFIQGIWWASVSKSQSISKRLYPDAGSGIIFNLEGEVTIGSEVLPEGVIILPVMTRAENIILSPGSQLLGLRFHPAISYGLLKHHFEKPTLLMPANSGFDNLCELYRELVTSKNRENKINLLYLWAKSHLFLINVIPRPLGKIFEWLDQDQTPGQLSESVNLSQRQIERIFKKWLSIAPKNYQRILRVNKAVRYLKLQTKVNLADVAFQFGFSDQAHMTREFQTIANITPAKVMG